MKKILNRITYVLVIFNLAIFQCPITAMQVPVHNIALQDTLKQQAQQIKNTFYANPNLTIQDLDASLNQLKQLQQVAEANNLQKLSHLLGKEIGLLRAHYQSRIRPACPAQRPLTY